MSGRISMWGTPLERFLGLSLFLGLLLPHTSTLFLLVNPLLCVVFILINLINRGQRFTRFAIFPILAILSSIVINMTGDVTSKSLLTAFSIILCLVTFSGGVEAQVKNIYLYICFGAILLSQVCYMFHLTYVSSFIDTYYPITWGEDFITRTNENVTIYNYSEFRLGGLYRNPNHLAKYVCFLLAIYLLNNRNLPIKKLLVFSSLCFISIVFTGSRTGFVIGVLLLLFGLSRNASSSSSLKRIFVFVAILGLVVYFIASGLGGRGMSVEQGMKDSAGLKFYMLLDYLSHENSVIYYIFGHLDHSLFKASFQASYSLDSEYGYIIYCFGFVGFLAFIYYLWKVYHHVEKKNRLFFWVLLWMISSTIIMSYRAVFVFFLLLSTIYPNDGKKRIQGGSLVVEDKDR